APCRATAPPRTMRTVNAACRPLPFALRGRYERLAAPSRVPPRCELSRPRTRTWGRSRSPRKGDVRPRAPPDHRAVRRSRDARCLDGVEPAWPQLPEGARLHPGGAAVPAEAGGGPQGRQVRRLRTPPPRGQGDRAHLREG